MFSNVKALKHLESSHKWTGVLICVSFACTCLSFVFTCLHWSLICLHLSPLVCTYRSFICTRLLFVFTRLHSSLISLHSSRHSSVISVIKNIELWAVKNISPLDFANYLSYSEVQKNMKVVNVWIRFQQVGSLFEICYKNALWEVFDKWSQFQIVLSFWELQVIRDLLYVRDIGEKYLNRLLLLLNLKSSHRRCSVKRCS